MDPRLAVAAQVRVIRRDGGPGVSGEMLDVSAGGVRMACATRQDLVAGDDVEVEIRVKDGGRQDGPDTVQLRGRGIVLRMDRTPPSGAAAVVRFTAPLDMREPFAQLLLF